MGVKDSKNKKIERLVAVFMVSLLTVGELAPLMSYAKDVETAQIEELTEGVAENEEQTAPPDNAPESTETSDTESSESTGQENTEEIQEGNIENSLEENVEIGEAEPEEGTEVKPEESEVKEEQVQQTYSTASMAVTSEDTQYVMATDADFSGTTNGNFRYIGDDEYVEIPHKIKGVNVTSYLSMFKGANVKGVKSTNKNVKSMSYMFSDTNITTLDVSQLDTSGAVSFEGMFYETTRDVYTLKSVIGMENFDTTNVTRMASMFKGSRIEDAVLTGFNTSNVTTMGAMFDSSKLKIIDISSFDTSNVTSFSGMFTNTIARDIIGEEGMDTSKATSMYEMFYGTTAIHNLDLSNFNTTKVKTMERMFFRASASELDLRSFDTSNVTNMGNMFQGAKATTIRGLENFDTSNVTNMVAMFEGAYAKELDLSSFDTSNITNMVSMFENTQATRLDVSSFDTSKVKNMSFMFRNSKALSLNLSSFDTSQVTDMSMMFRNSDAETLDLSSFNTGKVTNMSDMFYDSGANKIVVTSFDTTYVTTMKNMFVGTKVSELDLSSFDMRSVNNTDNMFMWSTATKATSKSQEDADKLNKTIGKPTGLTFQPKYELATDEDFIGTINGSFKYTGNKEYIEVPHSIRGVKVTSYKDMFANTKVKGVISTNKNVTDMSNMFKGNTATILDVSSIDTQKVINMEGMFQDTQTNKLDLRNFVTVNVTNMSNMFRNTKVNELDLGSFDLTKVTNTTNMFQDTKATVGYARTQEDIGKINESRNKPTQLTFTVWGITVKQSQTGWTNEDVNLKVESFSGNDTLQDTELVNNAGENILSPDKFNITSSNAYTGAKVTKTTNVTVPEWGVDDAVRFQSVRGNGDFQLYWGMSNTGEYLGQQATHSVYIRNDGDTDIIFRHNGLEGANSWTLKPGFSGRINSTGKFRTSHTFIQFMVNSPADLDITLWGFKLELGDKLTEYTPPRDKSNTEPGVYSVYSNGTYIFRATDSNGETRTVAHTVNNIDRAKPTAEVTKGTEGWTSQDVPLYITAKDAISGVKSITLPDGTKVNADKAEYLAKENKDYTFTIEDNAGNTSSVTTKVTNIDRNIPKLTADVDNKDWTRDPVNIKVTSEQSASGLADIKMISSPWQGRNLLEGTDGYVTQDTPIKGESKQLIEYKHTSAGNLDFLKGKQIVTSLDVDIENYLGGRVGYESSYRYDVGGDDHYTERAWFGTTYTTVPEGESYKGRIEYVGKFKDAGMSIIAKPSIFNQLYGNPTFKVGRPKVEIGTKATPWTPAPEDIQLINNSKTYPVVANGVYTFQSSYNNGTTSEVSVNVENIDLDAPTLKVEGNPEDYTEDEQITLNITASDNNQSGVKSITLPNGKVVNGTTATYPVTANGEYKFILEDNVGNKRTHVEKVDKMMISYKFYIYDAEGKPLKGVGYQLIRNGAVHATAESDATGLVDFGKVPAEGTYTIKQVKVPDGYVVNPDEKDVEVGDTTEPEEFVSYPRGKELPATGTVDTVIYTGLIGSLLAMWGYLQRKRKGSTTTK